MKQLNFLQVVGDRSPQATQHHHFTLFIDGASRKNPGPSGAGIYLLKDSELLLKKGFYLGIKTNNQAEYLALLIGLFFVQRFFQQGDTVRIVSDSELLVKQIKAEYRVKNSELQPLHAVGLKMMRAMQAQIGHVLRADNAEADAMANEGIDKKVPLPADFIEMIRAHALAI
jgi:ribonuclease HI